MAKIIGIIALILMLILLPPAALAMASQDAVPGDMTYPVKRTLEDVILAVASVNPITKAYFSVAQSQRRFKETITLIDKGQSATESLDELIAQTTIAADDVSQVQNSTQKKELIDQLTKSIDQYQSKLNSTKKQIAKSDPQSSENQTAYQVLLERKQSTGNTSEVSQQEIVFQPMSQSEAEALQIEQTTNQLNEIKKQLEEQKKQLENFSSRKEATPANAQQQTSPPTPIPTVAPTPIPTAVPSTPVRGGNIILSPTNTPEPTIPPPLTDPIPTEVPSPTQQPVAPQNGLVIPAPTPAP